MYFYIDPGTGSMLFTILIGLFGAMFYSIKIFFVKIKSRIGGGKVKVTDQKIPFVIFSDDKRYWTIFEPICKELDKHGKQVLYLTQSDDDPVFKSEFKNMKAECIGKGNSAFFRLNYLNATIVLSTTPGLGVYQWKRSKKVDFYIHIPHAASDITMYRMFGIDYYDAVLLSGDYQIEDVRQLEKLRNLPKKELVKVGVPYMDKMLARLKESTTIQDNKNITVLLAPSWGKSAIFGVYGSKIIEKLISTGYHIIIRPHPQSFESEKELMEKLMKDFPENENLEWNRDSDNFDVLRRSDIMISDFSGVIFDFALIFEKPIIYTKPEIDTSPYDVWWLKKSFWTVSALPKIGSELTDNNIDNIKDVIDICLSEQKYADGLKSIREETWAYIGEGSKNTSDYLVQKYKEFTSANQENSKEQENQEKVYIETEEILETLKEEE